MELILRTVLLIKVGILPFRDVWVRLVSICGINLKKHVNDSLDFQRLGGRINAVG